MKDWQAAGKELVDEEQQAAAKAAAKKAKKLRQKLNKQPTQQQPADREGSLQYSPSPIADNIAGEELQNTRLGHTQPIPDPVSGLSSLDNQPSPSSFEQVAIAQSSQAADVTAAMTGLGLTAGTAASTAGTAASTAGTAASTAGTITDGNSLVSAASSSGTKQGPGQQPLKSQPLPSSSDSSEAMDDDIFLQDLFTCPLTKVSKHCNTEMSYCIIAVYCRKHMPKRHSLKQTCFGWYLSQLYNYAGIMFNISCRMPLVAAILKPCSTAVV